MNFSYILISLIAWLSTSVALPAIPQDVAHSPIESLTQAGYKTAYLIDTKNYAALGDVMTKDINYDCSSLGAYGGKAVGLGQVQSALEAAIGQSKVEHLVTNLYVKELLSSTKARVITYITYSHWDKTALYDVKKTYRIYYSCDDIWVLVDGSWKMSISYVTNMGPKVEMPYFGK